MDFSANNPELPVPIIINDFFDRDNFSRFVLLPCSLFKSKE